ncbi:MAG TPA: hypothetical protein VNE58_03900 [Casimicrobiaceae bacterium]|nr:hypothetical protein [Casimicrobiaceae bacterium]
MTTRNRFLGLLFMGALGGCAAAPPADVIPMQVAASDVHVPVPEPAPIEPPIPAPMIESPPIELAPGPRAQVPREPQPSAPSPSVPSPWESVIVPPPATAPPIPAAPQVIIAAEPTAEEREFSSLLSDLQRYNGFSQDDLRKEVQAMNQALARARNDAHRVRLAVLYTLTRTTQDDQRAIGLFDQVAKSNPASPPIKQLAAVLAAQVAERMRAVRDEQARGEAAVQKLEALRSMERALLRDRVRSGGGGGGAGSGGN